ncbi:MAG TPA: aldo/keto reductase [Verrucomicrobiae bacterium]|jgi:aryl-alcohol dehydrogenase-like predicted oxidoreductase|nr:aldo/keto reductase [Verrucomicrobiae bacterium]
MEKINFTGPKTVGLTRRDFMKMAIATAAVAATGLPVQAVETPNEIPQRELGRTGEKVSCIGLGGSHIGKVEDEQEGIRIMRSAIDRGLTFMDNSWDYNDGDGASETRMGKALRDGYRDKVFLMTKFDGRTKKEAAKQIDESLRRLQTDHLDLLQLHEVIRLEDPDRAFAEGGAIEALKEAQKAGKCRFVGFTGHKDPTVHLRMLEAAAKHDFHFDTVQMPLNVMDAHFRSFQHQVLPELVKQGIGVLGMKSMGSGVILKSKVVKPIECLHYALNLPTSVVITGIDSMKILDQAIEAAKTFKPMTEEQVASLLARTADAAKDGKFELFKTAMKFDSTAQHPQWLGEES